MCGELLGSGYDRKVYSFNFDPTFVIKIDEGGRFANVKEWDMWLHITKQRPEFVKYLAPCHSISSCGRVLIQKKTKPLTKEIEIEVPSFIWDLRRQNWGYYEDRIVCHDYSGHLLYMNAPNDLVKVKL